MESRVRDVLDRAASVGRDLELADVHAMFRHGGPNPGADPAELDALRQRADLPRSYLEFLAYCDGWVGLNGHIDLFPIAELLDGPATTAALEVVEAYDEGSDRRFGLSPDRYLIIGAAEWVLSVVMLDLTSPPRVCWLTGAGVAEFPALDAFIEAVTGENLETIADLRADPWLDYGTSGLQSGDV